LVAGDFRWRSAVLETPYGLKAYLLQDPGLVI
jgi:hypothetical protein